MKLYCEKPTGVIIVPWRRWFAWYPVRLPAGYCVWLEWTERQGFWDNYYDDPVWVWEYRQ